MIQKNRSLLLIGSKDGIIDENFITLFSDGNKFTNNNGSNEATNNDDFNNINDGNGDNDKILSDKILNKSYLTHYALLTENDNLYLLNKPMFFNAVKANRLRLICYGTDNGDLVPFLYFRYNFNNNI